MCLLKLLKLYTQTTKLCMNLTNYTCSNRKYTSITFANAYMYNINIVQSRCVACLQSIGVRCSSLKC